MKSALRSLICGAFLVSLGLAACENKMTGPSFPRPTQGAQWISIETFKCGTDTPRTLDDCPDSVNISDTLLVGTYAQELKLKGERGVPYEVLLNLSWPQLDSSRVGSDVCPQAVNRRCFMGGALGPYVNRNSDTIAVAIAISLNQPVPYSLMLFVVDYPYKAFQTDTTVALNMKNDSASLSSRSAFNLTERIYAIFR